MTLSKQFGPHAGHLAEVLPVPPRLAFVLRCECGDWFRVTREELNDNDGKRAFALEPCEPITEAL